MPIDLTTVFQAVPYVQNVAHAEQVNPEAQAMATQALAQQALAKEHEQTQRIEKQDGADSVRDDEQRKGGGHGRQRRRHAAANAETQEEMTQASNSTPFAGHIINMKV